MVICLSFHLLLCGKSQEIAYLPCGKRHWRKAVGMAWSFRKRTVWRWLGKWFFFLPVLFKMMLLILVFCSLFKGMMDPCTQDNFKCQCNYLLFSPFSIAMATKENMTSQRGMLKSIQSKMNTLASILFESLKSLGFGGRGGGVSMPFGGGGQVAITNSSWGH